MLKHLTILGSILLFLLPCYATDISLDSWSFNGNFKKEFFHDNEEKFTRYFECKNRNDASFTETIELVGYNDNSIKLIFKLKKSNRPDIISAKEDFQSFRFSIHKTKNLIDSSFVFDHEDHHEDLYFSFPDKGFSVLKFLHRENQVPDFVVDRLLKETGWPDFRRQNHPYNQRKVHLSKL